MDRQYVVTLSCPDAVGIVAKISSFFADVGGSIVEAAYHSDRDTGWFFTRQAIRASDIDMGVEELRRVFTDRVSNALGPQTRWSLHDSSVKRKLVLLVSKEGHCLDDLLSRVERGELNASIAAVIGNHRDLEPSVVRAGIPFHHVPFTRETKAEAFAELARLVDGYSPDAVVLARFMQVLPPELCSRWQGVAINIHHSFLPSFVGAKPYHQAFGRGVKLIGATCHYVTSELDAGPIIEQDVIRVDHSDSVPDMVRQGRDIERVVLARGVRWHLEGRVLVQDRKTVVFT